MLRSMNELIGYQFIVQNESVGKCKDLLFDASVWTLRYFLADTGGWLIGRKVLVTPFMIKKADWSTESLYLNITKDQLENCPSRSEDEPVSREYEKRLFQYFGRPGYWDHDGLWGQASFPTDVSIPIEPEKGETRDFDREKTDEKEYDLRSFKEVNGYDINAKDGDIGHVEDIIVDDTTWTLRYVVVDTVNWLPGGKKVLLSLDWVEAVSWFHSNLSVNLSQQEIKNSPVFNPKMPINFEYEKQLYDYYGRPIDD